MAYSVSEISQDIGKILSPKAIGGYSTLKRHLENLEKSVHKIVREKIEAVNSLKGKKDYQCHVALVDSMQKFDFYSEGGVSYFVNFLLVFNDFLNYDSMLKLYEICNK